MKKLILLVMVFTLAFAGNAFAATSGDYEYTDNGDGTATITGYSGAEINLVIPDTLNSLSVTHIGANAFENKSFNSVVIPGSVKNIGQWAFSSSDIQSISLNSGLTTIGDWAFYGNNLTTLELPSSLSSLGAGAFQFNTALTNVKVFSNTVTFGTQVFYENQQGGSPINITLQGNLGSTAETYATANGHSFVELASAPTSGFQYSDNSNGTATLTGYNGTAPTDLIIPDEIDDLTVTEIGSSAFENKGLKSATVPSAVTIIGTDAFANNTPVFKLKGESGSAAESFATTNGIPFESVVLSATPATNEVSVLGNVYAVVLDFTVPLEVTFVIDPNQENPEDRFISPVLNVQNVTNAPVKLSIASFEMSQQSIDKGFQSVAPTLFTDAAWSKLNKADSKKLAVGIKANNNWQAIDNASTLYANNFSNEEIGTITANGNADFVFEAKHGNAFDKAEVIKYSVSFVIELG
jgi:hypothetical protein